jgi:hypothetical protein
MVKLIIYQKQITTLEEKIMLTIPGDQSSPHMFCGIHVLKKMIIVRNGKGKTFEEVVSRRKTGNALVLGQKENDKKCSTKHFIETKDRAM